MQTRLSSTDRMNDTVRFYDFRSRRITEIRTEQLKPGMIQVQVQGIEGLVWVYSSQVIRGPVRHDELAEELHDHVRYIHETFVEHMPISFAEWEKGFRRDLDPESEIAIWLRASSTYRYGLQLRDRTSGERRDIFKLIATALNAPLDTVLQLVELRELAREDAEMILMAFASGFDPE